MWYLFGRRLLGSVFSPRRSKGGPRPQHRPSLEPLEDRCAPAVVTTLQDGIGIHSLRDAIAAGGTVTFAAGLHGTIHLMSNLGPLTITQNVTINGPGPAVITVSGDGAIGVFSITGGTAVNISGLRIFDGNVEGDGAGIDSTTENLPLTLTNCEFNGNIAGGGGGAIALSGNDSSLILVSCSIVGNREMGNDNTGGGAILTIGGPVMLTNCGLIGNTGDQVGGGAIATEGASVTGVGCVMNGNNTNGEEGGGAIDSQGGDVMLTDSTLMGNQAANGNEFSFGGGAINSGMGSITLVRSTVSNNLSAGLEGGGGIDCEGGNVMLTNSTMSGNRATNSGAGSFGGGAIFTRSEQLIVVINSTIYGNFAAGKEGGGGIAAEGSEIGLVNTIVAGNSAFGPGPDILGPLALADHILISDGSTTGLVNGVNGNLVGRPGHVINPLLGPLQYNGGPTPTLALLPGSPAIDAGEDSVLGPPDNLTTDQRGFPRKFGPHVDIGAFEFEPLAPPPPHGRRNGPL
ncbi:MAG TPA: choice-of-anchor Q domain-containing protein [Gemmataceae bacterium]|nr:choice-of-anchor Q domain-containing protein [Gemmataceae bacterium]